MDTSWQWTALSCLLMGAGLLVGATLWAGFSGARALPEKAQGRVMADSFAVREAIKVAALAWIKWDQEMAQPCVCGHTAANHLEGGCRVIEAQAMCNCSCYEAAAQAPKVHDYTDPYGPDGMGGLTD